MYNIGTDIEMYNIGTDIEMYNIDTNIVIDKTISTETEIKNIGTNVKINDTNVKIKDSNIKINDSNVKIKDSNIKINDTNVKINDSNVKIKKNKKQLEKKCNNKLLLEELNKEINYNKYAKFNYDSIRIIENNVDNIFKFVKEELINNEIINSIIPPVEEIFNNLVIPIIKKKYSDDKRLKIVLSCIKKIIENTREKLRSNISLKLFKLINENIITIQKSNSYDFNINEIYVLKYENIRVYKHIKFTYIISLKY